MDGSRTFHCSINIVAHIAVVQVLINCLKGNNRLISLNLFIFYSKFCYVICHYISQTTTLTATTLQLYFFKSSHTFIVTGL